MATVTVEQESADDRFLASLDGEPAGITAYVERGRQRIFIHTEVRPEFGGQGVASTLIREALETTRQQGLRIVAICPFVAAYVAKHHDFDDILDAAPAHAVIRLRP